MAIFCLIVLGRRIALTFDETKFNFFIPLISCLMLLGIFYLYWYEGKEYYAEISGIRKKNFFYPGVIPNLVGAMTFFLYIFKIDFDDLAVVWGLLIVVSLWYLISVFHSLTQTAAYEDDAMVCEELNESQLKRLGKYAEHLRMQNSFKKE
jgi:cell division protein FtsW (lipid II flippase)